MATAAETALLKEYRRVILTLEAHTSAIEALTEAVAGQRAWVEALRAVLDWTAKTWTGRIAFGVALVGTLTTWGYSPEAIRGLLTALITKGGAP